MRHVKVIQMCQRCPCNYSGVCWGGMVVPLTVLPLPDFCPFLVEKQKRVWQHLPYKEFLIQDLCFHPHQLWCHLPVATHILSLQVFCETLFFLSIPFSSQSLFTHTGINPERKDHELAQNTGSIFLFLSIFKWCLGNISISSLSSKYWREEKKLDRGTLANINELPWLKWSKFKLCFFVNLKPELVTAFLFRPNKARILVW